MAKPILYGPAFSTYVRTSRIVLAEKGVDYDLVEVDFLQSSGMPSEQLDRQPFGKVPAFEHDGFSLYETGAITRYIDEAFDGPALQPTEPRARARMSQVMGIIDSYAYPHTVGHLVIQRLVTPMLGGQPDEGVIAEALPEVEKSMAALEDLLGDNEFMAGDAVSLADFHLAPVMAYFSATPESGAILETKPKLRAWWDRMSTRPNVKETEPQLG